MKCPKCKSEKYESQEKVVAGDKITRHYQHHRCLDCGTVYWMPATSQVPQEAGYCGSPREHWRA